MDTSSAPYSEQIYPYDRDLNYGRSDYNVGTAFKLFGMWQPVFFHGSKNWLEKIAGGWSLSGIWNWHGGFPWSPVVSVNGGSLYCGTCGYSQLLPAAYLGGAGTRQQQRSVQDWLELSQRWRGVFLDASLHCLQWHRLRTCASSGSRRSPQLAHWPWIQGC